MFAPWRSHNPVRITKSPITGKSFIHCVSTTCAADSDESAIGTQDSNSNLLLKWLLGSNLSQDSNCSLTSIFVFVLLVILQNRILQNNLLDLYLVEIRRYKLSFFAKEAKNFREENPLSRGHFLIWKLAFTFEFLKFWKIVAWSPKLPGGWN